MFQPTHRTPRSPLRIVLIAFCVVTAWKAWTAPGSLLPTAQAQIQDVGAQRVALIKEARKTNQLLTELLQIARQGTIKVRIDGADNLSAGKKPRNRR